MAHVRVVGGEQLGRHHAFQYIRRRDADQRGGGGAELAVSCCRIGVRHPAYRAGHAPSQVVLGGRKVAIRRPRARRDGTEVPLPTVRAFTDADPLNRRVVEQMLVGVATRQYARSLEPLGPDVAARGTSKSAVSRRFVAQTQAQLDAWRATPLDDLDLAVLLIDGVHVGRH